MKENNSDRNTWAEKLRDLPLPEAGESWQQMRALLEQEMPVKKRDWRWMYLLLSLLLFIGVCTWPGMLEKHTREVKKHAASGNTGPAVKRDKAGNRIEIKDDTYQAEEERTGREYDTFNIYHDVDESQRTLSKRSRTGEKNGDELIHHRTRATEKKLQTSSSLAAGTERRNRTNNKRVQQQPAAPRLSAPVSEKIIDDKTSGQVNAFSQRQDSVSIVRRIDTAAPAHSVTPISPPIKKDTSNQASDSTQFRKSAQSLKRENGFAVSVGLNHFFVLSGQERSALNSSGQSGSWQDYLPVPRLSYHLNRKIFVAAEAQFNAPQYTGQVMLSQIRTDTNILGQRTLRSVYVKKLFYFNLPLSMHVSPVKNLHLGGGIQFSKLTHAIGLIEEKQQAINQPDRIKTSVVAPIKTDSSYEMLRTNEWRLLADMSYTANRFLFGLRYNHALESFVDVPVNNSTLRQARNHSLQIYFRYNLWDQRRR